jgi:hypothetical protein
VNVESILERKGTEFATMAPEASNKRAADWLRAKNVGALVVTSNGAILGIMRLDECDAIEMPSSTFRVLQGK